MLFSLFLITTICNEERENRGVGELVSNRMNNLAFFVEFVHAGIRWIEVIVCPAKQIAVVNYPNLLTHVPVKNSYLFNLKCVDHMTLKMFSMYCSHQHFEPHRDSLCHTSSS